VQLNTRSCLVLELTITLDDSQSDPRVHGHAEPFWVFAENVNAEQNLHHEMFVLKERRVEEECAHKLRTPLLMELKCCCCGWCCESLIPPAVEQSVVRSFMTNSNDCGALNCRHSNCSAPQATCADFTWWLSKGSDSCCKEHPQTCPSVLEVGSQCMCAACRKTVHDGGTHQRCGLPVDPRVHGHAEPFWVSVENVNSADSSSRDVCVHRAASGRVTHSEFHGAHH